MHYTKEGNWIEPRDNVRYKLVEYFDFGGNKVQEYHFEIFKRPYFFGLIGKKRWEWVVTTNEYKEGLSFVKYILN